MKRLTTFMILTAFGLTLDRSFNDGAITIELAAAFDDAREWTIRSTGRVGRTFVEFGAG